MTQKNYHLTAEDRIKLVSESASSITINPKTKTSIYLKTGREMLRTAANYQEDGSIENAFILYTRFLTLFLEKIRYHPGYKDLPQAERNLMLKFCNKVLPKAELLKTELKVRYKKEHDTYLREVELMKKRMEMKEEFAKRANNEGFRASENAATIITPGFNTAGSVAVPGISNKIGGFSPAPSAPPLFATADHMDDDYYNKDSAAIAPLPQFDRRTKPKPNRLLSPIDSGLRQVIIPGDLVSKFLRLAEKNTQMNIETCGHLTGRITNEKFLITHLIIPKQKGTSDSCTTEHEEEIILIQDKFNLLTIGWIHTHPSQTAFLSSVDLHTHFSYQTMLPESIAIVCSPTYNEIGTFTLPSLGMDVIANCHEEGFHPHPTTKTPLFQDASHTMTDNQRQIEVHDIRFTSNLFPADQLYKMQ